MSVIVLERPAEDPFLRQSCSLAGRVPGSDSVMVVLCVSGGTGDDVTLVLCLSLTDSLQMSNYQNKGCEFAMTLCPTGKRGGGVCKKWLCTISLLLFEIYHLNFNENVSFNVHAFCVFESAFSVSNNSMADILTSWEMFIVFCTYF